MPGKHKEPTIAFRPSAWERAIIEQRAALSGMHYRSWQEREHTAYCRCITGNADGHERNRRAASVWRFLFV